MVLRRVVTAFALLGFLTTAHVGNGQSSRICAASSGALGDSVRLFVPDSGLRDAPLVSEFLRRRGFVVHCITNSKMQGTAGLQNVVGFQTDKGTITVFFLAAEEAVQIAESRVASGRLRGYYRYDFTRTRAGSRPQKYFTNVNGPWYFLHRGQWLLMVGEARLAETLQRMLLEEGKPPSLSSSGKCQPEGQPCRSSVSTSSTRLTVPPRR
jgi:hypothetical protein